MKPVRTKPRFRCDFCRFQATEPTVAKHERRCWRNPDRFCDACNNTGLLEWYEDIYPYQEPCPYCSKRDETIVPIPIPIAAQCDLVGCRICEGLEASSRPK